MSNDNINWKSDFSDPSNALAFTTQFRKKTPKTLFVNGPPGSGKTSFLCRAAVQLAKRNRPVVCYTHWKSGDGFREELRKEILAKGLPEESENKIKVIVVKDQDVVQLQPLVKKKAIVIFDMLNFVPADFFLHFYHKHNVIASFDCMQMFNKNQISAFYWLTTHPSESADEQFLVLTNSNRHVFFLLWSRNWLYRFKITGRWGNPHPTAHLYNVPRNNEDDYVEERKVLEIVTRLITEQNVNPEDIGVGASKHQVGYINEVLLKSPTIEGVSKVKVYSMWEWQFEPQIRHFIYLLNTRQATDKYMMFQQAMNVAVTRPINGFHLVADVKVMEKDPSRKCKAFLQWIRGEPMIDPRAQGASDAPPEAAPRPLEAKEPPKEPENRILRLLRQGSVPAPAPQRVYKEVNRFLNIKWKD